MELIIPGLLETCWFTLSRYFTLVPLLISHTWGDSHKRDPFSSLSLVPGFSLFKLSSHLFIYLFFFPVVNSLSEYNAIIFKIQFKKHIIPGKSLPWVELIIKSSGCRVFVVQEALYLFCNLILCTQLDRIKFQKGKPGEPSFSSKEVSEL